VEDQKAVKTSFGVATFSTLGTSYCKFLRLRGSSVLSVCSQSGCVCSHYELQCGRASHETIRRQRRLLFETISGASSSVLVAVRAEALQLQIMVVVGYIFVGRCLVSTVAYLKNLKGRLCYISWCCMQVYVRLHQYDATDFHQLQAKVCCPHAMESYDLQSLYYPRYRCSSLRGNRSEYGLDSYRLFTHSLMTSLHLRESSLCQQNIDG